MYDSITAIERNRFLQSEGTMDTTFYEEQTFNFPMSRDVNQLKRSLRLELNSSQPAKKLKLNTSICNGPMGLMTPDVAKMKLATPEVVKLIMDQPNLPNVVVAPTPTSSQILFPKNVTEEQENYVRGFEEALSTLHNSDSCDDPIALKSEDSKSYFGYSLSPPDTSIVKDEPQTVPNISCSPPVSPIDMDTQERIKLERKRQRNRVAASKCRKRKLERISLLEDKVRQLKGENTELSLVANKLKSQVCQLKEQVMQHVHHGCHIVIPSQL